MINSTRRSAVGREMQWSKRLNRILTSSCLSLMLISSRATAAQFIEVPPMPVSRDAVQWPFSSTSIWNTPIGQRAVYVAANLNDQPGADGWAPMPQIDAERIVLKPTSPLTPLYRSDAGWSGADRCTPGRRLLARVPIPASYTVPNAVSNSAAVFLGTDGRTLLQTQPLARCVGKGPATALLMFPAVDLYGEGRSGAHGGSRLSALGGSLRLGELRPRTVIRHALKINLYGREAFAQCSRPSECFRWPAQSADNNAVMTYGVDNPNDGGVVRMGALLAIPAWRDLASLGLETEPARLLAWTLQHYGAYLVDDTGGPAFAIAAEDGPDGALSAQFKADWGFEFEQRVRDQTPWVRDMQRLIRVLHVVVNNSPRSVGGGGKPLQPMAPPLTRNIFKRAQARSGRGS